MPSIVPGFEYDVFISYRHNDNLDGWVTDFVISLEKELKGVLKDSVTIYFDKNPHDGLLETHHVDKSLEGKLKCLIFIPIISQTYCDSKSFAWQHEFCVFNKSAKEDQFGRDIKLGNGNVASRILPIKIHELEDDDRDAIENEIAGVLRPIEFIYQEPGVNRPLKPTDTKLENQKKTDYRNQVNRTANAVKDLVYALSKKRIVAPINQDQLPVSHRRTKYVTLFAFVAAVVITGILFTIFSSRDTTSTADKYTEILDRAEKYLDEAERYNDTRYYENAFEAIQKVLTEDSLNERALYLIATVAPGTDTAQYFIDRLFRINPKSHYSLLARGLRAMEKRQFSKAAQDLHAVELIDPRNKVAIRSLSFISLMQGDYLAAWTYASQKYHDATGEILYGILIDVYLELGDFKEAQHQLELKRKADEFFCEDIENLQRIYLCAGDLEKLEHITDSVCSESKCDKCPFWILRAKMHAKKYSEAASQVQGALKNYGPITWRYPAFVLMNVGKKDSAMQLINAEMKNDRTRIADTTFHQGFPLYSLAAIYAMQGNASESLKWLRQYSEKGFEAGSEWYIGHDPLFDEMKKDPGYFTDFIQIVQKAQVKKSTIREKLRELEK